MQHVYSPAAVSSARVRRHGGRAGRVICCHMRLAQLSSPLKRYLTRSHHNDVLAHRVITQVEERVEQLLCGANKPFSVQTITDNLAQYGIKKGQVQKAAEMLAAEGGTITAKVNHCIAFIVEAWQVCLTQQALTSAPWLQEFGKTKLYFPSQANTAAASAEVRNTVPLAVAQC